MSAFTVDNPIFQLEYKQYICGKYCGKSYTMADVLKRHELLHRKEKLNICNLCGQKITEAGSLTLPEPGGKGAEKAR